jgi:hypothetical protein
MWSLKFGIFLEFGVWDLGFLWSLELGIWSLFMPTFSSISFDATNVSR